MKENEQIYKELENEDNEFLSEHEKLKKKAYEDKKNKIFSCLNRRRKQWNEMEKERLAIYTPPEEVHAEYCVYVEELIKFDEYTES